MSGSGIAVPASQFSTPCTTCRQQVCGANRARRKLHRLKLKTIICGVSSQRAYWVKSCRSASVTSSTAWLVIPLL